VLLHQIVERDDELVLTRRLSCGKDCRLWPGLRSVVEGARRRAFRPKQASTDAPTERRDASLTKTALDVLSRRETDILESVDSVAPAGLWTPVIIVWRFHDDPCQPEDEVAPGAKATVNSDKRGPDDRPGFDT
jgi:hypothetical protein